jgi:hypothetical protein
MTTTVLRTADHWWVEHPGTGRAAEVATSASTTAAVLPSVAHRVAGMSVLTESPVDVPDALGGLYYDLAGLPLPVALDGLLAVAGPERLLYGSDFPFTPAPFVTELAAALRRAPALRTAQLAPDAGSPGAALFPRLAANTRTGTEPQQESL